MTISDDRGSAQQRIEELEREIERLRKTNQVLLDRVEHRINVEGGAFAAFQVASNLEKTVADRTTELRRVNERLQHELGLRRSFETALLKAKSQAEEASASRTRFVAAASHDLRQPLNAAVLYLESMSRLNLEPDDAESLEGVELALKNLDDLLGSLLDISRLDSSGLQPQPGNFPLQPMFEDLAREYQSIARIKGLHLTVMPTSAVVHSDPTLLATVLRNLLSNAIKYTGEGRILMGIRRKGDAVSIEVRDTGIGVDKKHITRIFEEFWRAPGSAKTGSSGTGLGLSIVDRICKLLGTGIHVSSTAGKGSTFSLELPRGEPDTDAEAMAPLIPTNLGFNQCLVVTVDDNTQVLRSMERMLQGWDCKVLAATGVEEALSTIIDKDLQPRLLLADYHLADGADGISAINAINREMPSPVPAIMISSDNSTALRDQLEKLEVPLLTKPVDPARLRAVMQYLLARA